MSLSYT